MKDVYYLSEKRLYLLKMNLKVFKDDIRQTSSGNLFDGIRAVTLNT